MSPHDAKLRKMQRIKAGMMGTYLLALYVTLEQEEAIQHLFDQKKWLFDKIDLLTLQPELTKKLPKLKREVKNDNSTDDGKAMTDRCLRQRKVEKEYKSTRKKSKIKLVKDIKQIIDVQIDRKVDIINGKCNEKKTVKKVIHNSINKSSKSKVKTLENISKTSNKNRKEDKKDLLTVLNADKEERISIETKDELAVDQVVSRNIEKKYEIEHDRDLNFSGSPEKSVKDKKYTKNEINDYSSVPNHNSNLPSSEVIDLSKNKKDFVQTVAATDTTNTNKDEESIQSAVKTEIQQEDDEGGKTNLSIIREVVKDKVKETALRLKKNGSLVENEVLNKVKQEVTDSIKQEKYFSTLEYQKIDDFYVCPHCQRKFQWFGPFKKHVIRHARNEFDCKACGKKFTNYRSLMAHKFSRKKYRTFKCDICEFTTSTACLLRAHNKEKHPPEIYYHCHMCPKILKTKSYLNVHLKYSHNINDGKYECDICGKRSKRPKLFAKHMKLHEKELPDIDLTCDDCGKTFQSKLHLRSHSRIHKAKTFLCDFCGKGFCTKTKLNAHYRTHTGEKPYACTKCDYRSTQQGNLRLHMKVHDKKNPEKPVKQNYKCQFCNFTANRIAFLHQHLKMHEKVSDKRLSQSQKEMVRVAEIDNKHDKSFAESQKEGVIQDKMTYQYSPGKAKPNYQFSAERAVLDQTYAEKEVTGVTGLANSKKSLHKSSNNDLDKELETAEEIVPTHSDNRTDISSDPSNDPALLYPEYFRSYTTDQYNATRSGYQESAPHLMYLNQQRYYDTQSALYDSAKYTDTNPSLYSDPKYTSETSHLKTAGASNRSYGNNSKLDNSTQSLLLSSSGQILRQMLAASHDIYTDSSSSTSFNTRQPYQDNAYDASYAGMYSIPSDECNMSETAADNSSVSHKQQEFNHNKSLSRPTSNFSTDHLDTYTAAHEHDFTTHIPAVNSGELLSSYIDNKQQSHLYQTVTPSTLRQSGTVSPVFSTTEQEYTCEELERPSSAFRRVSQ